MQESAFERAVSGALAGTGDWIRRHDRFVVIGLVFSLLPLPPACFVGVLISLVNVLLLRTRALDVGEASLVRLALVLGLLNSVAVILAMIWLTRHVHAITPGIYLPYLPDFLNALLNHLANYLNWMYDTVPHKGMAT